MFPTHTFIYVGPPQYQLWLPHLDFSIFGAVSCSHSLKTAHISVSHDTIYLNTLFNAPGLTITSSAKRTAGLIVEVKPPQRAQGFEVYLSWPSRVITSSCEELGTFSHMLTL